MKSRFAAFALRLIVDFAYFVRSSARCFTVVAFTNVVITFICTCLSSKMESFVTFWAWIVTVVQAIFTCGRYTIWATAPFIRNNVFNFYQAKEGLEKWVPPTCDNRKFQQSEIYTKLKWFFLNSMPAPNSTCNISKEIQFKTIFLNVVRCILYFTYQCI